jgi:hypothetical protein
MRKSNRRRRAPEKSTTPKPFEFGLPNVDHKVLDLCLISARDPDRLEQIEQTLHRVRVICETDPYSRMVIGWSFEAIDS